MLRCQFLCHVLKALFFIKIALKLSYFCKKMQNYRALEAPPPDSRCTGGYGLFLQTTSPDPHWPPAPGGSHPDPQNSPLLRILATRLHEARKSGAYLLRQVLKADTKLSKYKSIWSEEVSSLVFKNALNASCKSILNQSELN